MNKTKVLLGLPTMGSINTLLLVTILKWVTDNKVAIAIYPTYCVQPVDNARNNIVHYFLESNASHLLFIDADTIPPPDALYKLLSHDKDIVSAITPIIDHDERLNDTPTGGFYRKWNCVDMNDKFVKPHTGLVEVKGAGTSCVLLKRSVFEKLTKPYYRFKYQDDVCMSEDIYFITNALEKGIKTYADTDILCKHNKAVLW